MAHVHNVHLELMTEANVSTETRDNVSHVSPVLLDVCYSVLQVAQSLGGISPVKFTRVGNEEITGFRIDLLLGSFDFLCGVLPAQLAYEVLRSLADLLGEVHFLDAFQDERVRHHLVGP